MFVSSANLPAAPPCPDPRRTSHKRKRVVLQITETAPNPAASPHSGPMPVISPSVSRTPFFLPPSFSLCCSLCVPSEVPRYGTQSGLPKCHTVAPSINEIYQTNPLAAATLQKQPYVHENTRKQKSVNVPVYGCPVSMRAGTCFPRPIALWRAPRRGDFGSGRLPLDRGRVLTRKAIGSAFGGPIGTPPGAGEGPLGDDRWVRNNASKRTAWEK